MVLSSTLLRARQQAAS
ncbi:unnamed protein product [Linum tenue]|uniref:Uncharacterized protein n=1 Tax=Linum tenue TaxID=586396 RepID=A0AAV0L7C3_9ROSI|nr:unnamed protein product [Linum tenue]